MNVTVLRMREERDVMKTYEYSSSDTDVQISCGRLKITDDMFNVASFVSRE